MCYSNIRNDEKLSRFWHLYFDKTFMSRNRTGDPPSLTMTAWVETALAFHQNKVFLRATSTSNEVCLNRRVVITCRIVELCMQEIFQAPGYLPTSRHGFHKFAENSPPRSLFNNCQSAWVFCLLSLELILSILDCIYILERKINSIYIPWELFRQLATANMFE